MRILSMEDAARYFIRAYGLVRTVPEIVREVGGLVTDFYRLHVQLKPGAAALLAALTRRGVKLCAATSGDGTLARAALERCGVLPCLGRVFTCAEVGRGKDSPKIYEAARAYLGTSARETAVFEEDVYKRQGIPGGRRRRDHLDHERSASFSGGFPGLYLRLLRRGRGARHLSARPQVPADRCCAHKRRAAGSQQRILRGDVYKRQALIFKMVSIV